MKSKARILIVDDDSLFHLAVKHTLKASYECRSAYDGDEALAILKSQSFDVVLLDIQMRRPEEGLELIPRLKELDEDLIIVMSSGTTEFRAVREAMRLGADDYVPKDFEPENLAHVLAQMLERRTLRQRREQLSYETRTAQSKQVLIGSSLAMQGLRRTIEKVRSSRANVLITGETGTGKEVVARQLRRSLADGALEPFVSVDSSTIQSTMAESILFGHEKGAFTGAERTTKGIFEEADGGTVYFDELSNMPLEIQAKLLRVLQEKQVTRLGSARPIQLEFRVVCATNRNLDELVRDGRFKPDLLQRVQVLPIEIPPLRERVEDIPALVAHFARIHGPESARIRFSEEAITALQSYAWPGNVRELSNVVAYLTTMAEGTEIRAEDLPRKILETRSARAPLQASEASLYDRLARYEKEVLSAEYQAHQGNISQLAAALRMDRSHLYTKLKEHGLR